MGEFKIEFIIVAILIFFMIIVPFFSYNPIPF
jgi:hypothetical protein